MLQRVTISTAFHSALLSGVIKLGNESHMKNEPLITGVHQAVQVYCTVVRRTLSAVSKRNRYPSRFQPNTKTTVAQRVPITELHEVPCSGTGKKEYTANEGACKFGGNAVKCGRKVVIVRVIAIKLTKRGIVARPVQDRFVYQHLLICCWDFCRSRNGWCSNT